MSTKNRIIVVDDEHDIIDSLRENLESKDLDVLIAQSGEEALKLLKMTPVDIILSDIKMPGMSGLELAYEVGQIQNRSPYLIYVTATLLDVQEMYQAGADGFVRKPIDYDLLEVMVKHFLKRSDFEKNFRNQSTPKVDLLKNIEIEAKILLENNSSAESARKILKSINSIREALG